MVSLKSTILAYWPYRNKSTIDPNLNSKHLLLTVLDTRGRDQGASSWCADVHFSLSASPGLSSGAWAQREERVPPLII